MGALTFKPLAYQSRPWEVFPRVVSNPFDLVPPSLTFHLRGNQTVRITSSGWLRDRVRFAWDGLRRQRLTLPLVGGHPAGWRGVLSTWMVHLPGWGYTFAAEAGGDLLYWLIRGYTPFMDGRAPRVGVSLDVNRSGGVYHGSFGLVGVTRAVLALPGLLPLEGVLTGPTGVPHPWEWPALVVELVRPGRRGFTWVPLAPREGTPREGTRALFQVSPLQRLLSEW